eukprot:5086909-Ditylum_brightwellii.AAC.1
MAHFFFIYNNLAGMFPFTIEGRAVNAVTLEKLCPQPYKEIIVLLLSDWKRSKTADLARIAEKDSDSIGSTKAICAFCIKSLIHIKNVNATHPVTIIINEPWDKDFMHT